MKIPRFFWLAALPLLLLTAQTSLATDLLVNRFTNFHTTVSGAQTFHKYDYETVNLSPDGSTSPFQSGTGFTYAITIGGSDPDAVFVNAYTAVLASAAGGYVAETPSSATRPTPGEASPFGWDSTFANDFDYAVLGEGPHKISSGDVSFKVWLITVRPRPAISVTGSMGFGTRLVNSRTRRAFTIQNAGAVPLQVTGIRYPGGFSGAWSGMIAVGASQSVTATFRPTRAKRYSGDIIVSSNASLGVNHLRTSGSGKARL